MQLSLINPYIRVAMPSVITPGHNIMSRVIYDYELIFLERGEFTLIYNNISYNCQAGNIIFIRPGTVHSFQIDRDEISQPHIHFDITHRLESDKIPVSFKNIDVMTPEEKKQIHQDYFSAYSDSPLIKIRNKNMFLRLFYHIISEQTSPLIKKSLMIQLLSIIIDDNFPNLTEERQRISVTAQIKNYIDAGNGFRMTLDDFTKIFYYGKFYLEKKFKAAFGVGIIEYRNKIRMEYAKHLLEKRSVTKVADELGFQSLYSFSRAYKRHFGIPPSKSKSI